MRFLKTAISDVNVAAVANSSKYVVTSVMNHLPESLTSVMEYGPGEGVATRALLKRLPPNGRLLAIESNSEFVNGLKEIDDPRFQVVHGNVRDIASIMREQGFQSLDAIISSIPFSFLTPEERCEIIAKTRDALAEEGSFIVFHQYSPLMLKPLRASFTSVTMSFEVRNIFPCFIFCARKSDASVPCGHPSRRLFATEIR
jgi:phospholipid N-methyltransferase